MVEMPGIEPGSTTPNHSLLRAYLVKTFCLAPFFVTST